MEKKQKKTDSEKEEREYIIPLRRKLRNTPRYKKTSKAIRSIKEFLARHMKVRDRDLKKIKLDIYLNEFVWARGIKKPPAKIKVKAVKEGENVRVELAELPEKIKFKKLRIEKQDKKATEEKKKEETRPSVAELKKKTEEKPAELDEGKEKETEEKKASVIEAGKEMEKESAKQSKHQTKISKEPKRQFRQALQK